MRTYGLIFPHDLAPSKRRFLALSPCGFALFIASPINHGGGACRCGGTLTWRKIRGQPVRTKLPLTPQGERLAKQGRRGRSSLLPTLQEVKFTPIAVSLTTPLFCPLTDGSTPSIWACLPALSPSIAFQGLPRHGLLEKLSRRPGEFLDVCPRCQSSLRRASRFRTTWIVDNALLHQIALPAWTPLPERRDVYYLRFRSGVFVSFSRSQQCISSPLPVAYAMKLPRGTSGTNAPATSTAWAIFNVWIARSSAACLMQQQALRARQPHPCSRGHSIAPSLPRPPRPPASVLFLPPERAQDVSGVRDKDRGASSARTADVGEITVMPAVCRPFFCRQRTAVSTNWANRLRGNRKRPATNVDECFPVVFVVVCAPSRQS